MNPIFFNSSLDDGPKNKIKRKFAVHGANPHPNFTDFVETPRFCGKNTSATKIFFDIGLPCKTKLPFASATD